MSATVAGALFPGSINPVVASPLDAFADEGPLHFIGRALGERLRRVFPEPKFDHQILDGKLTKSQWSRLTRRTPTVALGWGGITPDPRSPGLFHATSHWFLALITRNEAGPRQRLLGDRLAPGTLSMVRAAVLALNGYVIDPPDTPWAASGAVCIHALTPLYDDAWVDEALSVAGIELSVEYDEALPLALDTPNNLDAIQFNWAFTVPDGANGAWTDLTMGTLT